jgi:hypothetical protein
MLLRHVPLPPKLSLLVVIAALVPFVSDGRAHGGDFVPCTGPPSILHLTSEQAYQVTRLSEPLHFETVCALIGVAGCSVEVRLTDGAKDPDLFKFPADQNEAQGTS